MTCRTCGQSWHDEPAERCPSGLWEQRLYSLEREIVTLNKDIIKLCSTVQSLIEFIRERQ